METAKQDEERKQANYNQLLLSMQIGDVIMAGIKNTADPKCKIHGIVLTDIHRLGDELQCPECYIEAQAEQMEKETPECSHHQEKLQNYDGIMCCESCLAETYNEEPRYASLAAYEKEQDEIK